ncbi:MAG TPA: M48 family metalloprotease [Patescibacteria group bacterium]|jgi:heat shock protein HtpX|nr:M48 family metalloprotease [Patescibacteria group bacterium]
MNVYSAISANKNKTWLIMVLFVLIITTVVYVFSKALGYGLGFAGIALILAGITSIGSYYYSDKIILATSHAKPIQKSDNPELFRTVENLCIGDGLPMPKIYVINDPSPNAFATGRDPQHAIVCVTTGILPLLDKSELEGVIAHELSHIKNFDIRLMGIVAVLVGFIAILANLFMTQLWWGGLGGDREDRNNNLQIIFLIIGIILAILSPIVATLIQLAVSRKRELLADASGVLLTRYPEALASALEKISKEPHSLKSASNATTHLFIVNPFKGKSTKQLFSSLFDTHPPIAERIKILRSM